jgi:hypothetical protein
VGLIGVLHRGEPFHAVLSGKCHRIIGAVSVYMHYNCVYYCDTCYFDAVLSGKREYRLHYTYSYTYSYTHTHIHTQTHTQTHTQHKHTHTHKHKHNTHNTHTNTHTHNTHKHTHTTHTHKHTHKHTNKQKNKQTHTHTHTHTHKDYEMPVMNGPLSVKKMREAGCSCFIGTYRRR